MSDRLAEICAAKREEVKRRKGALLKELRAADASATDSELMLEYECDVSLSQPKGFRHAIQKRIASGGYALIAEIKKASPSKGLIRADFDPVAHARAYAAGGATCLSVLTDEPFFQGSLDHLEGVARSVELPCLRKDFMIDPWQVAEAREKGADAILIIVAALDDNAMAEIEAAALDFAMDVLIEVHDEYELDRALRLKSKLIGINNRNLKTFDTDPARAWAVAARIPQGYTIVSESGIASHADLEKAAEYGIRCFLVGEALMRQDDLEAATRALLHG